MDYKNNIRISLKNNNGFQWFCSQNCWCKGYAFIGNELYEKESLINYCIKAIRSDDTDTLLELLNGSFLIVIQWAGVIYLVGDKLRTFPLLYCLKGRFFYVFDLAEDLLCTLGDKNINKNHVSYFMACGYLYEGETLLEDCFLVPPSSFVKFSNQIVTVHSYHKRLFDKCMVEERYKEDALSVIAHLVNRLKQFARGRQIVIPLSGGYDSRLIACMCKYFGLNNISCFTYGLPDSSEVEIAIKVAKTLGYPLYFFKSNKNTWEELFEKDIVKPYLKYGGNLNSIAHLQDFFAIYELKKKELIDNDSIITPGHTGDLLAGNHFPEKVNKNNIVNLVYDKYFNINILNESSEREVKSFLFDQLQKYADLFTEEGCFEAIYQWNINSRQPNYIINSVRAYEYFGYSWFLPLWDDEFVRFWSGISCVQRKYENLYNIFLFDCLFNPMQVAFSKEKYSHNYICNFMSRHISYREKYLIKKFLKKMHLFSFPSDNSLLNEAAKFIREYGQYNEMLVCPRLEESMSAKSLYYLYYLNK